MKHFICLDISLYDQKFVDICVYLTPQRNRRHQVAGGVRDLLGNSAYEGKREEMGSLGEPSDLLPALVALACISLKQWVLVPWARD